MRGVGVTEALAALPPSVALLFALLTTLGDAWFVFGAAALLYWRADERLATRPRRAGATVVGAALFGFALAVGAKTGFALARPDLPPVAAPAWLPDAVRASYLDGVRGEGFGFPSGHAISATVAYGALAVTLDVSTPTRRWAAAGLLVCLVALSRLVLQVHYLVDVLAGVIFGLVALWALVRAGVTPAGANGPDSNGVGADADGPTRAFLAAVGAGLLAVAVAATRGHADAVLEASLVLGGALGGLVAWRAVRPVRGRPGWLAVLLGLGVVGGLWTVALDGGFAPPVAAALAGVAVAGAVAYPSLAGGSGESGVNDGPEGDRDGENESERARAEPQNVSR